MNAQEAWSAMSLKERVADTSRVDIMGCSVERRWAEIGELQAKLVHWDDNEDVERLEAAADMIEALYNRVVELESVVRDRAVGDTQDGGE